MRYAGAACFTAVIFSRNVMVKTPFWWLGRQGRRPLRNGGVRARRPTGRATARVAPTDWGRRLFGGRVVPSGAVVKDEIEVFAVIFNGVRGTREAVGTGGGDDALLQVKEVAEIVPACDRDIKFHQQDHLLHVVIESIQVKVNGGDAGNSEKVALKGGALLRDAEAGGGGGLAVIHGKFSFRIQVFVVAVRVIVCPVSMGGAGGQRV